MHYFGCWVGAIFVPSFPVGGSKGTLVRSWNRDLARFLSTRGPQRSQLISRDPYFLTTQTWRLNRVLSNALVNAKILYFCHGLLPPPFFILEATIIFSTSIKHDHILSTSCQNGQVLEETWFSIWAMFALDHCIFYSINDKGNILCHVTAIVTAYEVNLVFCASANERKARLDQVSSTSGDFHLRKYFLGLKAVSYTHLTLPTRGSKCRSRWSPYH